MVLVCASTIGGGGEQALSSLPRSSESMLSMLDEPDDALDEDLAIIPLGFLSIDEMLSVLGFPLDTGRFH